MGLLTFLHMHSDFFCIPSRYTYVCRLELVDSEQWVAQVALRLIRAEPGSTPHCVPHTPQVAVTTTDEAR